MQVQAVSCLRDNYAYLLEGTERGAVVIIDPSEAPPVEAALAARQLRPTAIWLTHHHPDHVGGVADLVAKFPGLSVVAGAIDAPRISGVTRTVEHGEELTAPGLHARALHIPGHTRGATAFVVLEGGAEVAVFTGDTLFCGGCGRLFEGTPAEMHRSLTVVLGALPPATQVYCGHEYTEGNLRFAQHVEPSNRAVATRLQGAARLRAEGRPTVPSTLEIERATNPFLRVHVTELRASLGCEPGASDTDVFAKLRAAKDVF